MNSPLRILLVEDNPADVRLIRELLRNVATRPYTLDAAETLAAGQIRAASGPDVVLLDLHLPDSAGLETLARFYLSAPELPIVVLTGLADDETAVAALQRGAQDYVTKDHLDGVLLWRAIRYAVERNRILREQERLQMELRHALAEVKQLHGLLPICSYCKKIRDDQNYWHAVEVYVSQHSDIRFSHGICPECYEQARRELAPEGVAAANPGSQIR